jgi:hypothetical protein
MNRFSFFAHPTFETLEGRELLSGNTISGYVFNDLSNNGVFQSGEQGINGNTLLLYKGATATGTPIATAISGANGIDGSYQFTTDSSISQTPITQPFTVNFPTQSTNWTQTQQVAQFNSSLGTLQSIQIISTATLKTDIGLQSFDGEAATLNAAVNGNLTLTVPSSGTGFSLSDPLSASSSFNAAAFNPANYPTNNFFTGPSGHDTGLQTQTFPAQSITITNNPNDPNAALFQLFQGSGMMTLSAHAGLTSTITGPGNVASQILSSAGASVQVIYTYIPSNALQPGPYTILQVSTPPGYLPGLKSSNGTVIANSVNTSTINVVLTNSSSSNNNFAEIKPATVSGFVYADKNNNGLLDTGEPGLNGVMLTLTGSNDLGAITPITVATQTGTNGMAGAYSFGNLRPGTYTVTESTQPAGYLPGAKSQGNVIVAGATAPDVFSNINLAVGATSANNDIGKVQASSLSGHVYVDVSSTSHIGLAGVTITLTGSNDLGAITPVKIVTATDGSYSFSNLRPGNYTIKETAPSGYNQNPASLGVLNGAPAGTSNGNIVSNDQFFVGLVQGETGVNYDFHEKLPPGVPNPTPPKQPPTTLSKFFFLGSTFRNF